MSHLYDENYQQNVKLKGFQTKKPVTLQGTNATLAVGGTSTFTGIATFTAAPVYNGGTTRRVISGSGATVTLTSSNSGSAVLMDRAAGIVFTLPAPVVGLNFDFFTSVTVTSNSYKVITDAGTTFIAGSALMSSDNLASKSFLGNGTTHLAVTQAAASSNATGGIIGSVLRLTCVSTTLWVVNGMLVASATPTTPFATS